MKDIIKNALGPLLGIIIIGGLITWVVTHWNISTLRIQSYYYNNTRQTSDLCAKVANTSHFMAYKVQIGFQKYSTKKRKWLKKKLIWEECGKKIEPSQKAFERVQILEPGTVFEAKLSWMWTDFRGKRKWRNLRGENQPAHKGEERRRITP